MRYFKSLLALLLTISYDFSSSIRYIKMAEVFGVVAGVASLVGVFTSCLECLQYIQLGVNFGNDYGKCQLRLDVVALRLSRWGLAVGLNNFNISSGQPQVQATQEESRIAERVLGELLESLQEARKASDRFTARQSDAIPKTLTRHNSTEQFTDPFHALHITTTKIISRRYQKETSFWQKTK